MALDNATRTEKNNVSVKQTNKTENRNTSEDFINKEGGVIASVETLKTSVKSWRLIQTKADKHLYKILEGCLHIKYMCEKEDLKVALLSLLEKYEIKGMKNKSISLCITKLVFGVEDKKCYTYSKVLENAAKLYLQTSAKTQTLSQYLTQNGGIDKLIRKEAVAVAKGYEDEKWGTEEHFGSMIVEERFGIKSPHLYKQKDIDSGRVYVKIEDSSFTSMFDNDNRSEAFVKMRYDATTDTFEVYPIAVAKEDKHYKSLNTTFNRFVGWLNKDFQHMWDKYIDLCDKENDSLKQKKAEDEKKLIEQLSKISL